MVSAKDKGSIGITMATTIEAHGYGTRSKAEERSECRQAMSTLASGGTERNMAQGGTPLPTTISTKANSWRAIVSVGGSTPGQTAVSMRDSGNEIK